MTLKLALQSNTNGEGQSVALPEPIALKIIMFLNERRSGNITLNVKDGTVLRAEIGEVVRA